MRTAIRQTQIQATAGGLPIDQPQVLENDFRHLGPARQLTPPGRHGRPGFSRYDDGSIIASMIHSPTPRRPPVAVSCPTCGRRFEASRSSSLPFCSVRCRQIDLGRWLNEEYGLTIERESPDDEGLGAEALDE